MIGDGHAGGQVKVAEFRAELAKADACWIRDLGAAVEVQLFNVATVLSKGPVNQISFVNNIKYKQWKNSNKNIYDF